MADRMTCYEGHEVPPSLPGGVFHKSTIFGLRPISAAIWFKKFQLSADFRLFRFVTTHGMNGRMPSNF
eukprot:scaffold169510_cov15-Prasinocladus_malaysianus.AAC.1